MSISNNNFQGITYSAASTDVLSFIANSSGALTRNINNNTFTGLNVNISGSVTFISDAVALPASGTRNVNNNKIVSGFSKGGAGGTVTLFTNATTSGAGAATSLSGNNFSDITVTGATTIAGMVNTDAGASATTTVQNDTLYHWIGASAAITAMNMNITGSNTVTANFANNIVGANAITGITTSSGNTNISANTVDSFYSSGAFAVTGITVAGGTTQSVSKNKIYNLINNNAGGTVNGMLISAGTTVNIYNNLIGDLYTPIASAVDPIRGINITSSTVSSNINLYYNTIYINATSSGINFGSTGIFHTTNGTATTAALDLRNNIITNTSTPNGTGITVAYRRSTTNLSNHASTSDRNLLFAGVPAANRLLFYDGTNSDQSLSAYKTRLFPGSSHSVTEDLAGNLSFLSTSGSSANYLHLDPSVPTQAESGAANIATYTTDIDGNIRQGNSGYAGTGTTPDIGADEIEGIHLSPLLAGIYTVGTGGDYPSLTGAGGVFSDITTIGLAGDVTIQVISDLTEDGTYDLIQWTEAGTGGYLLKIVPDAAVVRTISGNVASGMIVINGGDRTTFDGRFGGVGNYLTFRNTNTAGSAGTAFTFIQGSTGDTIEYCNIEGYADATHGVILFSTSTIAGGNSSNVIDNCYINGTVSGNTSNAAIYSSGTVGKENASNIISNNRIFDYKDRAVDITATGSTGWTITGNDIYNGSVSGGFTYAAASSQHGIRSLGGSGYGIQNNRIGGSAASAGGSSAVYKSTAGLLTYEGIMLTTTSASPISYIKGNTIANMTVSVVPTAATQNVFLGIDVSGSGISVGGSVTGEGNMVGSNSTNGSIAVITTSAALANTTVVKGINHVATGGVIVGNQVGGIDITNLASAATASPTTFTGIFVNIASAPTLVDSNIIGSTASGAATNSIRVTSGSTAVATSLTGISLGALITSTVRVDRNTVRNLSQLSSSSTTGALTGIATATIAGSNISVTFDTVSNNTLTATTGSLASMANTGVPTTLYYSDNTITGNAGLSLTTGAMYGIINSAAAGTVTMRNTNFSSNTGPSTMTGAFVGLFNNAAAVPNLKMNSNTLLGNSTNSGSGLYYAILNTGAVTTTLTIDL